MNEQVFFLQGNAAMAQGAFDAGARFYAGYPITPSSEVAEIASVELPKLGGLYVQMEDEISSMAAIIGASASGKKTFTATSGPGFSLMQENLGVAVMAEVPCVIIDVQRSGPSTGLATKPAQGDVMQARWGTHGDHGIIVLSPSSVEDCYYLTIQAFNFAELYRTPVVMLADEVVGHMRERAVLRKPSETELAHRPVPTCDPAEYKTFDLSHADAHGIAPLAAYGSKYRVRLSGSTHSESGIPDASPKNADRFIRHYTGKIEKNKKEIVMIRSYELEDAEVGIVAYGCSARSALAAVRDLRAQGIKAGLLQPLTLWPFPDEAVKALCSRVKAVVVPEMNLGQIRGEVERYAGLTPVVGVNRVDSYMILPSEIVQAAKEALGR